MQTVDTPAAQQLVGGLLLPRPVAGHPALELCNTLAGWGGERPHDYLATYGHLVALARSLELVSPGEARGLHATAYDDARLASGVVAEARRLRADLHDVLVGTCNEDALSRLNSALTHAAGVRRVTTIARPMARNGACTGARWTFGDQGLRLPLTALGWQVHRLLDDPVATSNVRSCPGSGCGWLFLDPRGQRRWCVMSLCGNRAKARRHADRSRR